MEGYLDTRPEFYKENGISTWADGTESKLVQSYINVPFGIEFRYNTNPVKFRKVNEFALRLLVNNAFLISTELDESVYSYLIDDNIAKQTADLKPYLASHYPGMTIDLTICTYLNFGVTWHKMSFEKAEPDLNFDGRSASPFYEMITDDGSYTDLSMYLGISIPLTQSQEIG